MAQVQGGGGGGGGYGGGGSFGGTPKPAVRAPAKRYVPKQRPIVRASRSRNSQRSGNGGNNQRRSSNYSGGGNRSSNGNGGSRGASARTGSTGVGSNSSGFIAAKPPAAPDLNAFLGTDSTFLQQKAALDKARQDYMAQQGQSSAQYNTSYLSDKDTLGKNRTQSLGDLENDYASRGMLQSGLYADSMSDMNTDYDKRGSALEQAKAAFMAQLSGDLTNFTSEQGLTLTRAQQEAAARRSAQYGV